MSYVCTLVRKPILLATRRLGRLTFTFAYMGSYESNLSEHMKEIINEVFNSWQCLGCKENNIPDEEVIPIFFS